MCILKNTHPAYLLGLWKSFCPLKEDPLPHCSQPKPSLKANHTANNIPLRQLEEVLFWHRATRPVIVFGQASPRVGMHIWSREWKISCVSRRWSHFPCFYGNRFGACSLLTLISFWTLSCSPQACAFVLFLLTMDSTEVMYELKLFFTVECYNWIYSSALWKGAQMIVFWEGQGLSAFWALPEPGDGLGFSKELFMYLASMTSCPADPSGIFAKLLKAAPVWKQAVAENLWVNFHDKQSWKIYAVLG